MLGASPIVRAVAASFDTLQEEAHRESIDFGDGLLVWFMLAIQAAIKSGVSRADVLGAIEQGRLAYLARHPQPTVN